VKFLLGLIGAVGVVLWVWTIVMLFADGSPVWAIATLFFPPALVVTSFIATPMLGFVILIAFVAGILVQAAARNAGGAPTDV
jgi:hypothetical protein